MPSRPDDSETAARTEGSTDLERAWGAEIERRVAAFRAGEMSAVPASEVFAEARSLVEER